MNAALQAGFLNHQNGADVHKTHLFDGRYENIYLKERHIPELATLLSQAITLAKDILQTPELTAGYWFNYMPPGAITTLHTHDDDDELLSGVYYVSVPENSGDLIIHEQAEKIVITPESGEFIFFKPDVRHEVSRNNSVYHRLSIGMNFGIKKDHE